MKFHLILLFCLFTICSCEYNNEDKNAVECSPAAGEHPYTLKQIEKNLEDHYRFDSIKPLTEFPHEEVYRLIWSGGWVKSSYFTFIRDSNHYQLILTQYAPAKNTHISKTIQLEEYEWNAIVSELDHVNFWCSDFFPGSKEYTIFDGTTYVLEGKKNGNYHVISWQLDSSKEKLLSRIIRISRLANLQPLVKIDKESVDKITYKFFADPKSETKNVWLLTETDTIKGENGQLTVSMKKEDTARIKNWYLIQFTFDSMVNKIPLAEVEFNHYRNRDE